MTDYTLIQHKMKMDPPAYEDDFKRYYSHFKSSVTTMLAQAELGMSVPDTALDETLRLVVFLNNISAEYKKYLENFPRELIEMIKKCKLNSQSKVTITKALIGLRSKGFMSLEEILPTLLEMLCIKDKNVTAIVYRFIINDIKHTSQQKGGAKSKQSTMRLLEQIIDSNTNIKVVKKVVEILGELFTRKILKEPRVINILANAIFHNDAKVKVKAMEFFLRLDEKQAAMDDETKEELKQAEEELRLLKKKMGIKKRTGKLRAMKKEAEDTVDKLRKTEVIAHQANWAAIDNIYDPIAFCDKLFRDIKGSRNRFAVRLMELDLLSRVIARREVICLPFYSFIVRYLYVRHENITQLLAYTAQAIHPLVPPDAVEPIVRTILNNFVSDRSRVEAQALGLNTVRTICERCPLVMNQSMLKDLTMYKKSHNKAVVSAARSLISLYRGINPELLSKKDRGRPDQQHKTILQYGEQKVYDGPIGAELLEKKESSDDNMSEEEDDNGVQEEMNNKEEDMNKEEDSPNDGDADECRSDEEIDGDLELGSSWEECSDSSDSDEQEEEGMSEEEDEKEDNGKEEDDDDEMSEEDDNVPQYDGGLLTQEQLEKIRRKQREDEGISSSSEEEMERDTTYVLPESLEASVKKKLSRDERIKILKESRAENEKFHRNRTGRTSKVLARNKPFLMKSFSKKQMKKEEDRITGGKKRVPRKQFSGKIRKRFGKSGLKQKSNGGSRKK
ncbi:SDA1 domain containing 1, putative [Entamoeba histolytica HM-3:IMSS]|uniref:Protein SDA1 n=1 Tax=Entamoeba histolytica HM-3:IMSS TaxID=885315 RepID=M7WTE4_ENTHI|nr:SDA1 domain containing 1, putative [Entamoeba histolytica HM-3:IMSS]